jgi:hypothetical protein
MARRPLFRSESETARANAWLGRVVLTRPVSFSLLAAGALVFSIALALFFVFGEYSDQSGGGLDLTSYAVGFGGRYGVAENVDVVGRIGWAQVEVDSGPFNADDDAYLIDLGLRGRIGDAVELEGGARYTDFSDGGDSTGLFVGVRFHFNATWALGAEYQDGDDTSTILAYVRASF